MHDRDVIVVGSGVAGMAAAIRLSIQGFSVYVFETNPDPGGKLSLLEKDGFQFDAGPSLFTRPDYLEQLFAEAGEKLDDYLIYEKLDLSCRYFFENGKIINAWTDPEKYEAELVHQAGEKKGALHSYLKTSAALYDSVGQIFLNHSLHQLKTWVQPMVPKALRHVRWRHLLGSLHTYNQTHFASPEAVQIFDRYATYNGSDPYQTPGMMSMIPHLELNQGTCYPVGGMIRITRALYELALKKGVQFYFNHPVDQILKQHDRVTGVMSKGEYYPAQIVVSNADIYFTYERLLKLPARASKVLKQERSCSGVIFYWGMKELFPELHLHNIFFSASYKEEFEHVFRHKKLFHDPTVYINITAKMDPSHAPDGKENWFVLINAPSNASYSWEEEIPLLKEKVIQKLSRILSRDIATLIETEEILDPRTIESKTGSYMGSLYGTGSNSPFSAFLRHANFSDQFENLYFCGGSVHPGGGIPLCFKSAEIVARKVKADFVQ